MLKLPSRDEQLPIMLLAFVYHTLWQYPSQYPSDFSEPYVQTKFKKSTSCWQQAGLLLKQNHTKQMIPFPSVSLPDSVIPCCIFQHKPWTELLSSLMLLLNEMLFIQNICLLFQRIFVLNTWFSLCFHLVYQEPCHFRFSFQTHKSTYYSCIELGCFFHQKSGSWGESQENNLSKKDKTQNTEHFNWTKERCVYTNLALSSATANESSRVSHSHTLSLIKGCMFQTSGIIHLHSHKLCLVLLMCAVYYLPGAGGMCNTCSCYTVGNLTEELLLLVSQVIS